MVDVVSQVRSVRAEMNVPAGAQIPLALVGASDDDSSRAERWSATIMRMARLSEIDFVAKAPPQSVQVVARGTVLALPLAGVIDFAAERTRLEKGVAAEQKEIAKIDAKLGNADFLRRAPEEVVEEQQERRETGGGPAGENVGRPENAGLIRERVGYQLEVQQAQADRQRGGGPGGRARRDERAHDLS